ncbi:MAG TPA: hypothetical protein VIE64_00510 [Solirubrobacterales bacterium]|jgi:hypothetical protein
MSAPDQAANFIPAGLASLGIEADEVELAVISGAHQVFWPGIQQLLALDTRDVEPERNPDLSKAP